ncbi:putative cytotoxin domain protein [Chlamydia ibidis 10-1398/6]|uniref:Cytotoxin domain protein n=1 Tax=Chlamydia ibidis 10-1398/6 TaxID=1046581 RepID=A0ABN0MZE6_9CHLA|nr:hypothetical protein [Chlamydia ibidis]EQM62691.1 putative cytotoxin domain protein [Chlamydia ibidis 10-1398/6]
MSLPEKISSPNSSQNHNNNSSYHLHNKTFQNVSTSFNSDNDITLYNALINQNNTTEDVVKIGGLIQNSIHHALKKKGG